MLKVGFTGTRYGMTPEQKITLRTFAREAINTMTHFAHGDCVGADDEAANIIYEFVPRVHITVHPPLEQEYRAHNPHYQEMREAKTHFARNRDIVDGCNILLATPKDTERQDKGGTWYTIDYARKKGKDVLIIWPNGSALHLHGIQDKQEKGRMKQA